MNVKSRRFKVVDILLLAGAILPFIVAIALKVLFSTEEPIPPKYAPEDNASPGRRGTPGSLSFVPSAAGLMIAGEIIRELTKGLY